MSRRFKLDPGATTGIQYRPIQNRPMTVPYGLTHPRGRPNYRPQSGSGRQTGGDFWQDVGNFFAPAVHEVDDMLKETRILSTIAAPVISAAGTAAGNFLAPGVGGAIGGTAGGLAGKYVGNKLYQAGYGKKKRKGKKPGPKPKKKPGPKPKRKRKARK